MSPTHLLGDPWESKPLIVQPGDDSNPNPQTQRPAYQQGDSWETSRTGRRHDKP